MSDLSIELTSLRAASGGDEVCLSITLTDGEHTERRTLTLLTAQYAAMKPERGPLSREFYEKLVIQSDICAAVRRGIYLLGFGASSQKGLVRKLQSKGIDVRVARSAVAYLTRTGYINEESDALREAERGLKKRWDKKRIASSLFVKGYGEEVISHTLDSLDEDEIAENCRFEASKLLRGDNTLESRKKAYASLSRMGYSSSEIRAALSHFSSEYDE